MSNRPSCCRRLDFETDSDRKTTSADNGSRRAARQRAHQSFFAEQQARDAVRAKERWGFDFAKDVPASTSSPYVWECVLSTQVPSFYSRVCLKRNLGASPKKTLSLPSLQERPILSPILRSLSAPATAASDSDDLTTDSDDGGYSTTDGAVTPTGAMFASIAAVNHQPDDADRGPPVKLHRPNPQ